jgi:4-hydroxy-4-methyl-2-oxoglutarate aldolase
MSRADPAMLAAFDTGTLYEAASQHVGCMEGLRRVSGSGRMTGRARTVLCRNQDNLSIHHAVAAAYAGDVLVVQTLDPTFGMWGEVLTVAAQARGVRGLVIDGGVRDVEALRRLEFPVFARATAIRGAQKRLAGVIDTPIGCGGQYVRPGDLIVGDDTGLIVVEEEGVEAVAKGARDRARAEKALLDKLERGSSTVELLQLPTAIGAQP